MILIALHRLYILDHGEGRQFYAIKERNRVKVLIDEITLLLNLITAIPSNYTPSRLNTKENRKLEPQPQLH